MSSVGVFGVCGVGGVLVRVNDEVVRDGGEATFVCSVVGGVSHFVFALFPGGDVVWDVACGGGMECFFACIASDCRGEGGAF